jgi:hypothetical protein
MSDHTDYSSGASAAEHSQTLTDRVLARVADARLAADQRANTSSGKPRRRRPVSAGSLDSKSPTSDESRESESLKRVFRDLGTSYRRYRSQTGDPVVPGLRDAAYTFRAEPSLTSLVAVAAYLDELDLLS